MPDGDEVYYLDQIDSQHNLRLKDWTGHRLPLYATSDGKLYLAHWPESGLAHYLRRALHPHSPNTITDPEQLRAELAQIRRAGYAWNQREYDPDIVSVAAPIYNDTGQMVAAVCLFGPFFRFPAAGQREESLQATVATAQQISARLQLLNKQIIRNGNYT